MSRISIDISEEQHKKIKILAALQHKTIKDFILENIFAPSNNIPNKATIEAIEDIKNNKNLNMYSSVDELFEKFGQ